MKIFKNFVFIFLGIIVYASTLAQAADSSLYENGDYRDAVEWLKSNPFIEDSLAAYHVPPDEALAIVFPELMRYSALEDKMEVTGLMVLYARLGKDYADFSVGRFQMKPSFIQHLEVDASKYLSPEVIRHICPFLLNGNDEEGIRKKRVNSLTDVKKEVSYLALFYKIVLAKFRGIHSTNPEERIRFLATAYNCGYHHSAANLYARMKKKQFPVYDGLFIHHVNYADLSLFWWQREIKNPVIAVRGREIIYN